MISQHLTQTADAILSTYRTQHTAITNAVNLIRQCRDNGGTVYVAGNGGSSATAAHFVNDLVKAAKIRAACLTDNVPLLTAYSNDEGYSSALADILDTMVDKRADALLCVSVSGNSPNIIEVVEWVRTHHDTAVIGLGSQRRGRLAELTTVFIEAQSEDMMISESTHLAVIHAIVGALAQ